MAMILKCDGCGRTDEDHKGEAATVRGFTVSIGSVFSELHRRQKYEFCKNCGGQVAEAICDAVAAEIILLVAMPYLERHKKAKA